METFDLPPVIADLIVARNKLRAHYREVLRKRGGDVQLEFTLDGNLVGDLGEAIAVELFGIRLVEAKSTGTGRGPAFRRTETRADHLLFLDLDFENAKGTVVYNGPEHHSVALLPDKFVGQRSLTRKQMRDADTLVKPEERLHRIKLLRD